MLRAFYYIFPFIILIGGIVLINLEKPSFSGIMGGILIGQSIMMILQLITEKR